MKKILFLLGGYDLEMVTIKHILDDKGLSYHNNKLSWGGEVQGLAIIKRFLLIPTSSGGKSNELTFSS